MMAGIARLLVLMWRAEKMGFSNDRIPGAAGVYVQGEIIGFL